MILTSLLSIMLCFFVFLHNYNPNVQIFVISHNHYLTQAVTILMLDAFCLSSKLLQTFTGHNFCVNNIDYSRFDDNQYICSGSYDNTVRVWDVKNNKQIQLFNGHLGYVYCVKFSPYHYYNHCNTVICSSSSDNTIRFWDIKDNRQLQIFSGHADGICGIDLSSFNYGHYLCSGSFDTTIRLWDVETSKSLHVFKGHENSVWCVDFSPVKSNSDNNDNKSNIIGVIGGNGYTICSGSKDKTIRIWDIETVKPVVVFKGHEHWIRSAKYGSNKLGICGGENTILSGSWDKSIRLWDIRSGQQIQVFNGHTHWVAAVEYSPFVVDNIEFGSSSNVICSGSWDNSIRFWDIRSNKKELHAINGDEDDDGIICLKFIQLKRKRKGNNARSYIKLCYGSGNGPIRIWG
ncbi:WD-40 repeat protein [Reticulomyxa filosa]|uniref:WD-40 repeat protein n=1 Tax=Reticulomyxa filosa TaxID=46433 RepID=X6P4F5_RETFI|nr:WD-40 repeat protein [Reticulomyxa filosa]|eukprot:ETO33008.1 WD-40 repeat protein [Reticulomyxa filosa]